MPVLVGPALIALLLYNRVTYQDILLVPMVSYGLSQSTNSDNDVSTENSSYNNLQVSHEIDL